MDDLSKLSFADLYAMYKFCDEMIDGLQRTVINGTAYKRYETLYKEIEKEIDKRIDSPTNQKQ